MPLYRGKLTLDSRLNEGETVKAIILNKDRTAVYLTYERPPQKGSIDQKPQGYGLPGGRVEKEETVRDASYREVICETGFVTVMNQILTVRNKRSRDLNQEWHRLIVVEAEIVPADKPQESTNGMHIPQAQIVEKDEVDQTLAGWFPLNNLPTQIARNTDGDEKNFEVVREGIYQSHFQILWQLWKDEYLQEMPICKDLMHAVDLSGVDPERFRAATNQPTEEADDDLPIGWDEKDFEAERAKAQAWLRGEDITSPAPA